MSSPAPVTRPALGERNFSSVEMTLNLSGTVTTVQYPRRSHANASTTVACNHPSHHKNHARNNESNMDSNSSHNNPKDNILTNRHFLHTGGGRSKKNTTQFYYMRRAAWAIAEKRKAVAAPAVAAAGPHASFSVTSTQSTAEVFAASTAQSLSSVCDTPSEVLPVTSSYTAPTATTRPTSQVLPRNENVPVIIATIDSDGVRIRDGNTPDPNRCAQQRTSNARLSRSVSRGNSADKEHFSSAGNDEAVTPSASISRRPTSVRDNGSRDRATYVNGMIRNGSILAVAAATSNTRTTHTAENEWEGSMPRRKSSLNLIARNARSGYRAMRTPVEQDSSESVIQRSLSRLSGVARDDEVSSRPRRQQQVVNTSRAFRSNHGSGNGKHNSCDGVLDFKRKQSQIALSNAS